MHLKARVMKSTASLLDVLYSDIASLSVLPAQIVHDHQAEVWCVLEVSVTVNKGFSLTTMPGKITEQIIETS